MFWALIMEPYKRYTQRVKNSFHVSMASLDTSYTSDTPPPAVETSVQVMVNYMERNFLLCTLKSNTMWQVPLDLNFEKGTSITFLCTGQGTQPVHLTGYLLSNEDIDSDYSEEEEEEEEQGKEIDLGTIVEKNLKRKAESPKSGKRKLVKQASFDESNNLDDDVSEENNSSLEEDSFDEDTTDEIEENDDDDEEEEQEQKQEKLTKSQKRKKKELENQQQHQQKTKRDKQNKINGEEVKQEQQSKKQKKKAEQQTQQNSLNEAKKRIVEGGVQVEDIRPGNGALATSGKLVTVYYVGRCKIGKAEKKIDECMQGMGFKFRLGRGQVIRGWDAGIPGMKVGGKRRLTIPSNMGYGAKGSPPAIPGNSTLVFDVELKNVS